jgi:uncharacterized membrane protein YadS
LSGGRGWLAILMGVVLRSVWEPGKVWLPGIHFCAKQLLEFGVMLLGASINVPRLFTPFRKSYQQRLRLVLAEFLTVLAMAALGPGVNPRTVFRADARALAVVGWSLLLLVALGLALIWGLAIT